MKEIEQRFSSVENHNVGQVMGYFMEEFHRTPERPIMDYDIALIKSTCELSRLLAS